MSLPLPASLRILAVVIAVPCAGTAEGPAPVDDAPGFGGRVDYFGDEPLRVEATEELFLEIESEAGGACDCPWMCD